MEELTLDLPAMYGDHHVTEVRRILLALPGVNNVNASSGFHVAEVTYDPSKIDVAAITAAMDKAGYLGELGMPFETGEAAVSQIGEPHYLRHTVAYQQTGRVIGFTQNVENTSRALWPCPGMEPQQSKESIDGEEKP